VESSSVLWVFQHKWSCLEHSPEEASDMGLALFYFPFPCLVDVMLRISFDNSRRYANGVRRDVVSRICVGGLSEDNGQRGCLCHRS